MIVIFLMITLLTNHWDHKSPERQKEIDHCINQNINNPYIDRVVILGQSSKPSRLTIGPKVQDELATYLTKFGVDIRKSDKIIWEDIKCDNEYNRPTFRTFFDVANKYCSSSSDYCIITNSDIYFDGTINLLRDFSLGDSICIALSRYAIKDGSARLVVSGGSQDSWIFQGRIRPINADFPAGINGCDTHLNWLLACADYRLTNPCLSIKSYHVHANSEIGDRGHGELGSLGHKAIDQTTLAECKFGQQPAKVGIMAFSLFGDKPKYCQGAIYNAKLAKFIYPGWDVRIYYDETVPADIISTLRGLNVDLIKKTRSDGMHGMFWRLFAADDTRYDKWVIRDADSRLGYREKQAVDDWIESGLPFHTMRDHPYHEQPIMGCAFGGLTGSFQMAEAINGWTGNGKYGDDEHFLAEVVWPQIKNRTLVHDSCSSLQRWDGGVIRPFPTPREFGRFVGEIFDENDHCNIDHRAAVLRVSELR